MPQAPRFFGEPRKGGRGIYFTAPVVVGTIAACVLAVTIWSIRQDAHDNAQAAAELRVQDIVGPPCPQRAATAVRGGLMPVNIFDFDDVKFGYRYGAADCTATGSMALFGGGYQLVCQFSSPAVLSVSSGKGLFYFETGVAREATLFVKNGAPRCVLASPEFAQWKRAITETDEHGKPTYGKAE